MTNETESNDTNPIEQRENLTDRNGNLPTTSGIRQSQTNDVDPPEQQDNATESVDEDLSTNDTQSNDAGPPELQENAADSTDEDSPFEDYVEPQHLDESFEYSHHPSSAPVGLMNDRGSNTSYVNSVILCLFHSGIGYTLLE